MIHHAVESITKLLSSPKVAKEFFSLQWLQPLVVVTSPLQNILGVALSPLGVSFGFRRPLHNSSLTRIEVGVGYWNDASFVLGV